MGESGGERARELKKTERGLPPCEKDSETGRGKMKIINTGVVDHNRPHPASEGASTSEGTPTLQQLFLVASWHHHHRSGQWHCHSVAYFV